MPSSWRPRKLKPTHLEVLRLHFQGLSNVEIANITSLSDSTIQAITTSQDAEEILNDIQSHSLDTIRDIATDAQAIAPRIFEEQVRLSLHAKDERVRVTSGMNVLAIAGHLPIRRFVVQQEDPRGREFDKMSEEEIKKSILADLTPSGENKTIH